MNKYIESLITENEHQKNDIQKTIQLLVQEETVKHHQVREKSVNVQKVLKYNQKNEKQLYREMKKILYNNVGKIAKIERKEA